MERKAFEKGSLIDCVFLLNFKGGGTFAFHIPDGIL